MSTSGVTTWQLTAGSLVNTALRKLQVISKGQAAEATDTTNGLEALNAMLKSFQVKGMPLWAISEYSFPMTATRSYSIGVGQTLNTPAPLKVIQAYNKDTTSLTVIPMEIITHYNYNLTQPISTSAGTPVQLEYERGIQTGTIHLWPFPDSYNISNRQITVVYQRPFEDIVSASDNIDFPQEWHEAVIYGLAWRLSPEFGIPINDRKDMEATAQKFLEDVLSFGTEEGSMYVQPNWVGR